MLYYILIPLLAALLSFATPAFAQEEVSAIQTFGKANVSLPVDTSLDMDHYRVIMFDVFEDCPAVFTPNDQIVAVYQLEKLSERQQPLLPGTYVIGTYMLVDRGTWSLNQRSCRTVSVHSTTKVLEPYAPFIDRVPDPKQFFMNIVPKLPVTQPAYYLLRFPTGTCPKEHHDLKDAVQLNQPIDRFELSGGTWSLGVYRHSYVMVPDPKQPAMKLRTDEFILLKGSCQAYNVTNFSQSATYQPQLPAEILADYVAPEIHGPTWLISGSVLASYDAEFVGGGLLRGEYLGIHPLVLTAAIGADFPSLRAGSNRITPGFELGAGYAHSTELNSDLLFDWNITGNVGLGSVLTHCGPTTFDATQAYTCGHHEEGFPVLLSAPWFGPAASIRVLSAVNAKDKPAQWLSFGLGGSLQIYALLDGDRQVAVQTTEGEEKISYRFGETTTWFKPVAVFEIGYAW